MASKRPERDWRRGRSRPRQIRSALWRTLKRITAVGVIAATAPTAAGVAVATLVFVPLPADLPEIEPFEEIEPTRFYLADGTQVGEIRGFDSALPMTRDDIPDVLIDALVASEDRSFFEHSGVDVRGILRAAIEDLRAGGVVQGGSTITQQLVKQTVVGDDVTIVRKVEEAVLASRFEREFSKDEILLRYLQVTYFGEGAYGAAAAADTYFRKPLADLDVSEAATLVGLIPAPSAWNPRADLSRSQERRDLVVDAMVSTGRLDADDAQRVKDRDLFAVGTGEPPEGATLIWPAKGSTISDHHHFVDYARRYLEDAYGDRVYTGGLQVYLSLDTRMQAEAQAAVDAVLEGNDPQLEMSVVSVEPQTGLVKALIGGRDYNAPGGRVNLALGRAGGGSGRQPGSSFKPFVLAAAFEQGIEPTTRISGATHVADGVTIRNYGGAEHPTMDLYQATARSSNTVFTRLIDQVGVEATIRMAQRLGADVADFDPAVHGLSVALGAMETSPLSMASAYGTFANHGTRVAPTPVLLVVDSDGEVLEDNRTGREGVEVVSPAVADTVTEVLTGPFAAGGTAYGKGLAFRPAAGKTGTTQENRDAWFVGFVPQLSTAVWIGYRDDPRPLTGINGVGSVTGGTIPAAVWQRYMAAATAGMDVISFQDPAPLVAPVEVVVIEEPSGPEPMRPKGRRPRTTITGSELQVDESVVPVALEPAVPPRPDPDLDGRDHQRGDGRGPEGDGPGGRGPGDGSGSDGTSSEDDGSG